MVVFREKSVAMDRLTTKYGKIFPCQIPEYEIKVERDLATATAELARVTRELERVRERVGRLHSINFRLAGLASDTVEATRLRTTQTQLIDWLSNRESTKTVIRRAQSAVDELMEEKKVLWDMTLMYEETSICSRRPHRHVKGRAWAN